MYIRIMFNARITHSKKQGLKRILPVPDCVSGLTLRIGFLLITISVYLCLFVCFSHLKMC